MRFLFVSGFHHLPQMYGGVMSNTHELALELMQRDHQVSVAAKLLPTSWLSFRTRIKRKLTAKQAVCDNILGYPVYRPWNVVDALPDFVRAIRPDVAIVQPSDQVATAKKLSDLSVPVIVYLHDVLFDRIDGDLNELKGALFLANSEFTARRYREKFGIDATVIPPLFRAALYQVKRKPQNITLINPQPFKGSDLALQLVARCPEIPFCFVESWELPKAQRSLIQDQMKVLPNLTLKGPIMKMGQIYRQAKIILAPSRLDEAWGRIASEAHFSGIPVVASNRGGLPEAVGPGGILLDPDGPIEDWVNAIRKLWHDEDYYNRLSAAALAYSQRPEIDPDVQIKTLLQVAERAIERQRVSHSSAS
jgi:glycosyltransferase involved in cell wall biosynthesis